MNTATTINISTSELTERTFIQKVYTWMAGALGITAVVALITASSPALVGAIISSPLLFFGIIIGELGLVMYLSAKIESLTVDTAIRVFLAYAFLNGLTFALIFLAYTTESIASTFFVTAGTFGFMSYYGYTTKKDLTSIGSMGMMALFGIIIASVVNIFLRSSFLYWFISYAGVLIFVGLTAYDTQKIKALSNRFAPGSNEASKGAIMGALTLYLDFVNLFLMLLRILGNRRN